MSTYRKDICFVVGAPRSGTTWLQRLLQIHPEICGGEESHFFTLFAHPLSHADEMYYKERRIGPLIYIAREDFEGAIANLWDDIFQELYKENPDSRVHLEKTPFHALCLNEISRVFPEAKVIFLARDSRAVASSLVHAGRSWGARWAPTSYKDAAAIWLQHVKAVQKWREQHKSAQFLFIRYEDLVDNTSQVLGEVLDFLLPQSAVLSVDELIKKYESSVQTTKDPSGFTRLRGIKGWQKDMPLYAKWVIWRNTRRKMRELGYEFKFFG
ncbi:MAG: sulfotransferase [Hyphomicrobiales bacterium]